MKKLLAILLILALLLPAVALSDETDQIIGSWYMMIDVKGSIFESSFPDVYRMILILTFDADGNIYYGEQDYHDNGKIDAPQPGPYGKWEKNGSEYSASFFAAGTDKAFFEDDLLYVAVFGQGMYFGFRKMEPLDPYYNVYRK